MFKVVASLAPAAAAMSLVLASCDGNDPVAPGANDVDQASANVDVVPPVESSGGESGAGTIPERLHGRWAMTPADCTSPNGDTKGLLVISGQQLRFYESVASPGGDLTSQSESVSGNFDFSGEGSTWTRYQSLKLQDGKLVRTETNPATSYTYVRCD